MFSRALGETALIIMNKQSINESAIETKDHLHDHYMVL